MKVEARFRVISFFCLLIVGGIAFIGSSCKQKPFVETNLSKYKINDLNYLVDFIDKNKTANNNICLDSFNLLYRSLIAYNLDDSNLIFASFCKERVLLISSNDSIKIYKGSLRNSFTWLESEVGIILETQRKNSVDSAINLIKKELEIVYLYNKADSYVQLLAFNRKADEFFILDYYWRNWFGSSFSYVATIKNEYVKMSNLKLIHAYPYDVNSRRYVSPHLSEILSNATNKR